MNVPRHLHVFLSSPADVSDERSLALRVLERLPNDPFLRGRVTIEAVAWDKPGAGAPLPARLTPQEAIDLGLPKPSECEVVVLILWSRIGTLLQNNYVKPDGSRYLSGTEWEFEDALRSDRTVALVYRRTEPPQVLLSDPELEAKREQYDQVEKFFAGFRNPDGSYRRSYKTYESPADFQEKLEHDLKSIFRDLLAAELAEMPAPLPRPDQNSTLWKGSPYPGLRQFLPQEGPIFFGRGPDTDALLRRLSDPRTRFLVVVGASGSGKSSVVSAGLLPRLQGNAISGSKDWIVVRFTPGEVGDDPFLAVAVQFAPLLQTYHGHTPRELAAEFARGPEAVANACRQVLTTAPEWAELLLFIDQFEELFTLVEVGRREAFIRTLEWLATLERVRMVITLRADFLAKSAEIPPLAVLLRSATHLLPEPDVGALHAMITGPAAQAGLVFEEGVVGQILEDSGRAPGALALVAYTLLELYRAREHDSHLTREAYEALGGVHGAISRKAEGTFSALDTEAQAALPLVFRKLVRLDVKGIATRRRAELSSVMSTDAMRQLVDALTTDRLLVHDSIDGHAIVEVAHEAIFTSWPRLARWLEEDQEFLLWRERLHIARREWERVRADTGTLLRGIPLTEAVHWLAKRGEELSPVDQEFIRASQEQSVREVRLRAQADQSLARQLAAQAELVRTQRPDQLALSVALATESLARSPSLEGEQALRRGMALLPYRIISLPYAQGVGHVIFSPSDLYLAASGTDYVARVAGALSGKLLASFSHDFYVTALAFSPDGRYLATAAGSAPSTPPIEDNSARLFDLATQKEIARIRHQKDVDSVVFSRDGRFLATASRDGSSRIWDIAAGREFVTLPHPYPLGKAVFSPDGTLVATASGLINTQDRGRTVKLWRVETGEEVATLAHDDSVATIAFSPDGKLLASGSANASVFAASQDLTARLWSVETGNEVARLPHNGQVFEVAFDPAGKLLATACADGAAHIWEIASGRETGRVTHGSKITRVAFRPGGDHLLTVADDDTARLWAVASGEEIARYSQESAIYDVAFSPSGRYVAAAGGRALEVFEIGDHREVLRVQHPTVVDTVLFSADGTNLITRNLGKTFAIHDMNSGSHVVSYEGVMKLTPSPDRKFLFSSGERTVRVWETDRAKEITQLTRDEMVQHVQLSLDGRILATGGNCKSSPEVPVEVGHTRLWEAGSWRELIHWDHGERLVSLSLGPDGKHLITVISSSLWRPAPLPTVTVQLWDAGTGREMARLPAEEAAGWLGFSPDGRFLLTAGYDGVVHLRELATGAVAHRISHHGPFPLAFDPTGEFLVTTDPMRRVRIWEWREGDPREIASMVHTEVVGVAVFSPDGKYLATATGVPYSGWSFRDSSAHVWETTTGREVGRVLHGREVNTIAFSPNGRYLATGSSDSTVRVSLWRPEDLRAEACRRLSRNLTLEEWRTHLGDEEYRPTCVALPLPQDAIDEFARILAADLQRVDALCLRGLGHAQTGELAEAVAAYTQALVLDPNRADALCFRGMAYEAQGEIEKAIEDYDRAIERGCEEEMLRHHRGLALLRQNDLERAVRDLERAVELDPDDAFALYSLACAYTMRADSSPVTSEDERMHDLYGSWSCLLRAGMRRPWIWDRAQFDPRLRSLLHRPRDVLTANASQNGGETASLM
jgi:WD40 repeat protein